MVGPRSLRSRDDPNRSREGSATAPSRFSPEPRRSDAKQTRLSTRSSGSSRGSLSNSPQTKAKGDTPEKVAQSKTASDPKQGSTSHDDKQHSDNANKATGQLVPRTPSRVAPAQKKKSAVSPSEKLFITIVDEVEPAARVRAVRQDLDRSDNKTKVVVVCKLCKNQNAHFTVPCKCIYKSFDMITSYYEYYMQHKIPILFMAYDAAMKICPPIDPSLKNLQKYSFAEMSKVPGLADPLAFEFCCADNLSGADLNAEPSPLDVEAVSWLRNSGNAALPNIKICVYCRKEFKFSIWPCKKCARKEDNATPAASIDRASDRAAAHASKITQRVNQLNKKGKWQPKLLPLVDMGPRKKCSWDYFLDEVRWIAEDFAQEIKIKKAQARTISRAIRSYWAEKERTKQKTIQDEKKKLRQSCAGVAKLVKNFWTDINIIIDYYSCRKIDLIKHREMNTQLGMLLEEAEKVRSVMQDELDGIQTRKLPAECYSFVPTADPAKNRLLHKHAKRAKVEFEEQSDPGSDGDDADGSWNEENDKPQTEITSSKLKMLRESISPVKPSQIFRGCLRDYQKAGLNWLVALFKCNLNGILADEMGLGKTIQVISLLAYLASNELCWGPHLIIVPTSVILNWAAEFEKWAPGLRVLTYFGSAKERSAKRKGWNSDNFYNVIIVSYSVIIRDILSFKRKKWQYMILDEAHNIKNSQTQRWQQLLNIKASYRLLLTGTPMQNSLMELWSLLHFLMPAIFRHAEDFQAWFSDPMTMMVEGSLTTSKALLARFHSVLRPFILRRLKCQVENEMPKKTEIVRYCHLSKRQRALYDDFIGLTSTQEKLKYGSAVSILGIVMQLRKVCNHPNIFDPRGVEAPFVFRKVPARLPSLVFNIATFKPLLPECIYIHSKTELGRRFKRLSPRNFARALRVRLEMDRINSHNTSPIKDVPWKKKCGPLSAPIIPRQGAIIFGNYNKRPNLHKTVTELLAAQSKVPKPCLEKQYVDYAMQVLNPSAEFAQKPGPTVVPKLKAKKAGDFRHFTECRSMYLYQKTCFSKSTLSYNTVNFIRRKFGLSENNDLNITETVLSNSKYDAAARLLQTTRAQKLDAMFQKLPCAVLSALTIGDFVDATTGLHSYIAQAEQSFIREVNALSADMSHNEYLEYHRKLLEFPESRLIEYDCGKLQELRRLLAELHKKGSRVLIFTQMSKMLDILQAFLSYHKYTYLRLDGATSVVDRQTMMNKFNDDKSIFCFILSTRAGGVGMNLTGANTVIFYDSDWNPTMDAQAQDRCHRIGQTQDVTIYRLISVGTIEENILKKANQKKMLARLAIDDGRFVVNEKTNILRDILGNDFIKNIATEEVQVLESIEDVLAAVEDDEDARDAKRAQRELEADFTELDEEALKQSTLSVEKPVLEIDEEVESQTNDMLNVLLPVEKYALEFKKKERAPELEQMFEETREKLKRNHESAVKGLSEIWEAPNSNNLAIQSKPDKMDDENFFPCNYTNTVEVFVGYTFNNNYIPTWLPPTPPLSESGDVYTEPHLDLLYDGPWIPDSNTQFDEDLRLPLDKYQEPAPPLINIPEPRKMSRSRAVTRRDRANKEKVDPALILEGQKKKESARAMFAAPNASQKMSSALASSTKDLFLQATPTSPITAVSLPASPASSNASPAYSSTNATPRASTIKEFKKPNFEDTLEMIKTKSQQAEANAAQAVQATTSQRSRNRTKVDLPRPITPPPPYKFSKEPVDLDGTIWHTDEDLSLVNIICEQVGKTRNTRPINWEHVSALMSLYHPRHYRSPRQCCLRWQLIVLPREEQRNMTIDPISKKTKKVLYSEADIAHVRKHRVSTAQQWEHDRPALIKSRFLLNAEGIKAVYSEIRRPKRTSEEGEANADNAEPSQGSIEKPQHPTANVIPQGIAQRLRDLGLNSAEYKSVTDVMTRQGAKPAMIVRDERDIFSHCPIEETKLDENDPWSRELRVRARPHLLPRSAEVVTPQDQLAIEVTPLPKASIPAERSSITIDDEEGEIQIMPNTSPGPSTITRRFAVPGQTGTYHVMKITDNMAVRRYTQSPTTIYRPAPTNVQRRAPVARPVINYTTSIASQSSENLSVVRSSQPIRPAIPNPRYTPRQMVSTGPARPYLPERSNDRQIVFNTTPVRLVRSPVQPARRVGLPPMTTFAVQQGQSSEASSVVQAATIRPATATAQHPQPQRPNIAPTAVRQQVQQVQYRRVNGTPMSSQSGRVPNVVVAAPQRADVRVHPQTNVQRIPTSITRVRTVQSPSGTVRATNPIALQEGFSTYTVSNNASSSMVQSSGVQVTHRTNPAASSAQIATPTPSTSSANTQASSSHE